MTPDIEVVVNPVGPGREAYVGWYCIWRGKEYGNVVSRLVPLSDTDQVEAAKKAALHNGTVEMQEVLADDRP